MLKIPRFVVLSCKMICRATPTGVRKFRKIVKSGFDRMLAFQVISKRDFRGAAEKKPGFGVKGSKTNGS